MYPITKKKYFEDEEEEGYFRRLRERMLEDEEVTSGEAGFWEGAEKAEDNFCDY